MNQDTQKPEESVKFNYCGCPMELSHHSEPRLPTPEEINDVLYYTDRWLSGDPICFPDEHEHSIAQDLVSSWVAVWDAGCVDKLMIWISPMGEIRYFHWQEDNFSGCELGKIEQ